MRYLLDTDMCIYLIRRKPKEALARLQSLSISDVGISSITLGELEYGVAKSRQPAQNKIALLEFAAPLEIVSFDDEAAAAYGHVRAFLEAQGAPIGPVDTLLAAHALALRCVLVTNNQREFSRVPHLLTENWVSSSGLR
jgi:tRNA(fMet)-specific endonuclease VapC